jgi:hypothetical protein
MEPVEQENTVTLRVQGEAVALSGAIDDAVRVQTNNKKYKSILRFYGEPASGPEPLSGPASAAPVLISRHQEARAISLVDKLALLGYYLPGYYDDDDVPFDVCFTGRDFFNCVFMEVSTLYGSAGAFADLLELRFADQKWVYRSPKGVDPPPCLFECGVRRVDACVTSSCPSLASDVAALLCMSDVAVSVQVRTNFPKAPVNMIRRWAQLTRATKRRQISASSFKVCGTPGVMHARLAFICCSSYSRPYLSAGCITSPSTRRVAISFSTLRGRRRIGCREICCLSSWTMAVCFSLHGVCVRVSFFAWLGMLVVGGCPCVAFSWCALFAIAPAGPFYAFFVCLTRRSGVQTGCSRSPPSWAAPPLVPTSIRTRLPTMRRHHLRGPVDRGGKRLRRQPLCPGLPLRRAGRVLPPGPRRLPYQLTFGGTSRRVCRPLLFLFLSAVPCVRCSYFPPCVAPVGIRSFWRTRSSNLMW